MINVKNIFKRWKDIKQLINCDEYFLGIAYHYKVSNTIKYDYLGNTKRKIFWKFMNDCTENNMKNTYEK